MVVDKGWSGRQSAECLVTRLSLPSHDEIPVPGTGSKTQCIFSYIPVCSTNISTVPGTAISFHVV